ncbi:ATP-dependent nuclease [Sphingopyxis sp. PET50]|uniref:ATP-dependent nuclease n=1 Tax=Sphingopyxis sp. PET50 TaxID=2976533 RepID=UPI0021AFB1CC|nr:ATP-binding protein [Sphingopyxis sp. PET50]
MSNSREMRRLVAKWQQNTGWPKRLDWIEIDGIRGWDGQRIPFNFPIVAIVGENGSGKSTILQSAAAVYQPNDDTKDKGWFASDFLPKTIWEDVRNGEIGYSIREGDASKTSTVRKPGDRWRGNPERPKRKVDYIDLRRIQPIVARTGYSKLAKDATKEMSAANFDKERLNRLSQIMGRQFSATRMALTDADNNRIVPVFSDGDKTYSGYHSGAGQMTVADLLRVDPEKYSLLLIDEIETSLHPRAQRRLIRDLAELCRERDMQIIVTTHSPYVLAELPLEARVYLMQGQSGRHVMTGVSPEFAMTRMDEYPHPECELYVEDSRSETLLREIIVAHSKGLIERCSMIPFGMASVGRTLGIMVSQGRFPRPSHVFLDGDQSDAPGCSLLPGGDAPERVVFGDLQSYAWGKLRDRVGRPYAEVADACIKSMSLTDHHDWVNAAASKLTLPGETLWQAMCAEWATTILPADVAKPIVQLIGDLLLAQPTPVSSPTVRLPLFERSVDAFEDSAR